MAKLIGHPLLIHQRSNYIPKSCISSLALNSLSSQHNLTIWENLSDNILNILSFHLTLQISFV